MNTALYILTFFAAIGCGITGGIMYAFSTFVMRSLGLLKPAHGIEAMQVINRTIINPWFMIVFMGSAVACVILAISTYWDWQNPATIYLLAGSLLYFAGTFLVTMFFNVPMNNALEVVEPTSMEAAEMWIDYLRKWTFWNHVRTAMALLGTASFMYALQLMP